MRVHRLLRTGNRDGIGGTFLRADLAADTLGDLDWREHHPGTLGPYAGNGALAFACTRDLAFP